MSTRPSRDSDYAFPPAPSQAVLDREVWDAVMRDISARIRVIEEKGVNLDDLIADLSFNGQARLDAAVTPLIDAVRTDLAALSSAVAKTLADNAKIISDFQEVTAVNLDDLREQIGAMEDRIAVVLAGGLDAGDVRESATRAFVTPEQRTEIGTLRTDLDATRTDHDARLAAIEGAGDEALALQLAYSFRR